MEDVALSFACSNIISVLHLRGTNAVVEPRVRKMRTSTIVRSRCHLEPLSLLPPTPRHSVMVAFDSDVFAAPLWLSDALTGPAAAVGLPQFAQVAHITFLTCLASFTLQRISHTFCPKLFPKYYPTLKPKQDDWDLHVVSIPPQPTYPLVCSPALYCSSRSDGPTPSSQPHSPSPKSSPSRPS
jgi:hypothetical protein